MELRQLRYFVAVADAGSFSGAAAALGVIQPTVSQHIQRLESRLHTNLFERYPRGVRLTHAGQRFLRSARRIIYELDQATGQAGRIARAEAGALSIGFYVSLSTGPLRTALAAFRAEAPEVALELQEGSPPDLLAALREHRIDVALTVLEVASAEFATLHLWDEELAAVLPEDHPLATREAVSWSDLAEAPLVLRTWESGSVLYTFLAGRVAPDAYLEADQHFVSREALLSLVGLGFGATVIGESATGVAHSGVVFKPIAEPDAAVPVTAAWLKENDNPARGRFVAVVRDLSKPAGNRRLDR
ncbi:LysR family transcriptional regulator [Tistrella mobilis]|uniref:LysR family transcriptional regulator n=1 Tax=Tistrella mobilis (strain KA081020-065) TaxID=1110502 RepID=I3TMU8_TISMK|nr:LysR family transcriptional regulator [Tistrella mobilis]AFK54086.1 LysR family transcriptional regulator [Tistrella mobilis KA081020-065]